MILAIFLIPILYFANAFLIGRIVKKFKISTDAFYCTIIGFFAFFTIFYFFDIFIYAANSNIWVYLIFFSIIQAILLIIYAINWKLIFITFSFNLKKFLTFVIVFGLTILISWLCLREIQSDFGTSWVKTITNLDEPSMYNTISFRTDENDVISNFSTFNIFNIFWINSFHISGYENCLNFCQWSWIICGAGIMGCLATWLFPKNSSIIKVIISPIICLTYLVLILAFIESFAICDTWIMVLTFVYILTLIKKETNGHLKLAFLLILLLSFLAINCTSFYTVICLYLFSVYWAARNKENSINYLILLVWPIILIIFSFVSLVTYWIFALANAITLLLMLIIITLLITKGSPVWTVKIARSIAKNSSKVVYTALGIMLAIILIANFFIFHEIYHWQGSNINWKNFLTFTYKYIWSIEITSDASIAIINAVLYIFFVALIIAFIIVRNVNKTSKLYHIAKTDSAIKLTVACAAIFINPLVIHVLKLSTSAYQISLPLNSLVLNIVFVAPLFIFLLKLNYNLKSYPVKEWKYNWF